jgi:signal transduction histidine kinase
MTRDLKRCAAVEPPFWADRLPLLEERARDEVGLVALLGEVEALRREAEGRPSPSGLEFHRLALLHAGVLGKLGRWRAAEARLQPALAAPEVDWPTDLRARIHNLAGILQRHLGDRHAAYAHFHEAESLCEARGDAVGLVRALINQANLHGDGGDHGSRVTLLGRALEVIAPEAEPILFAQVLVNAASGYLNLADAEMSAQLLERARPILEAEPVGSRLRAQFRMRQGMVRLAQQRALEALLDFDEAVRLAGLAGDEHTFGLAQMGLGQALTALGRYDEAALALERAEGVFAQSGNRLEAFQLNLFRGELHLAREAFASARRILEEAVDGGEALGDGELLYRARRALAEVATKTGRLAEALDHLEAALECQRLAGLERSRSQINLLRLRLDSMQERHARELEAAKRRQLEDDNRELAQNNDQLERLVFERRELLAIVAHDLRSPLSTVVSAAEVAETNPQLRLPELRDLMISLGRTAEDAIELLDHLLSLERMDSALLTTRATEVRLHDALHAEMMRVLRQAEHKRIELRLKVSPHELCLRTDAKLFTQIVTNFLSNAVKYTPHGGRIELSGSEVEDGRVEVVVADSGPGIPEGKRRGLFTRFFLAGSVATGGEKSTGLGLYLVRRYADLLGARVGFRPNAPTGSIFFVRLPTLEEE